MKPREFLSRIGNTITVADAAPILHTTPAIATKILSQWTKQGWLCRVGHGLYAANPISSTEKSIVDTGFAIVADLVGDQGYICGWSALEHWGITEQIFIDLSIASFKWTRFKKITLKNRICHVFKISQNNFIGLKPLWYQDKKVFISDVHKTILDIIVNPACGGGFIHVSDCFRTYFNSEDKNIEQILQYANKAKVRRVFYKRFGYLLEINNGRQEHIDYCYVHKTTGYSPLDPKIKDGQFCSRWKLIIPKYLKI